MVVLHLCALRWLIRATLGRTVDDTTGRWESEGRREREHYVPHCRITSGA